MRYPRWFRLLLAALVLQLSTLDPLWAQGELSFTRQDFGVGDGPGSVTVGDFNGDGRQDLATAVFGGVSILLGNGDGTFEPAQDFGVQEFARSVTVGDFNGDGRQDLATSGSVNSVYILLGNGDGTFEPAQDCGIGGSAGSVTVGDFNQHSRFRHHSRYT
jgi:hypothetical protein